MWLLSLSLRHLIRRGTLAVIDASGGEHVFEGSEGPSVTMRLHDHRVATRLAINPELYLGEAYTDGTVTIEDGDIYDLINLVALSRGWHHGHWAYEMLGKMRRILRWFTQYNPVKRARQHAAHHYDLSIGLYEKFLDQDLQYSCGYFLHPEDPLEAAQQQKKAHIATKLCLKPGQRILDIGCGWGGLARYLSEAADVNVTGITLSEEQLNHARSQNRQTGGTQQIDFRLEDYREVEGQYDRIVSVGMFEHVGVPHYPAFFKAINDRLADDGVALLHTIGRSEGPDSNNPWLEKYIFPGGYMPALSEIIPAIERAGLSITDIEVLRLHYAYTLRAWRRRFAASRDAVREMYNERFCRMWEFYLAAAEVSFRHAGLVVYQIQLAKQQDTVLITRDYVTDRDRLALHRPDKAA